jgi:hypothetical protein
MGAPAGPHTGARHRWTDGAAGGGAPEADPVIAQLVTFPAQGGTPESDGTVGAWHEPPEALLAWWRRVCEEEAALEDAPPADLDAIAWTTDERSTTLPREGGKGGPGGGSPPGVSPSTWATWVNDWLRFQDDGDLESWDGTVTVFVGFPELDGEQLEGGDAADAAVHWIHNEQRATTCSPLPPDPPAGCEVDSPAERRAVAEVRGWPEVGGLQRRNRRWEGRHQGSRQVGVGLQVPEATKEEHRLGERIAHCGERLIFRSPNCECDPTARPLLVGANLCTHRMCHHCAKLRSRKLAARVHEMFGKLRAQGITRYALMTLTYRDTEALDGCVERAWRDFRKLRQRKLWEQALGCLATIEIKRGQGSGLWHPHLHVLVARPSCTCLRGRRLDDDGPRCAHGRLWCPHALNQCCISEAWREITGESFVVDIRAVRAEENGSMAGAVREVVKYCTKLTEVSSKQREDGQSDVLELHRAIRGRRLLTTTGAFRGLVEPATADELLNDPESKPCPFCWTPWGTVTAMWDEGHGHYQVRAIPGRWNRGFPSGLDVGSAARSGERGL